VAYNGIETEEYKPDPRTNVLGRFGIDPPRPTIDNDQ
jgi:starch synthase